MPEAVPSPEIDAPATTAPPASGSTSGSGRRWSWRPIAGLIVVRALVPLWISTGATFKLVGASPRLLPKELLGDAHRLGLDLYVVLATLIGIEYLVAAAILFVARLSRPLAAFMLVVFCLVLAREIAAGNTSCGCLGANSPSPWTMLGIDGVLLLGVILLPPARIGTGRWWTVAAAAATGLAGAGLAFFLLLRDQ